MSGGVGDIRLSKEEEEDEPINPVTKSAETLKPQRSFLTFRHLNALALMIVFAATGMVSIEDMAFVILSFFYMYFLSKISFPSYSSSAIDPPIFGQKNRILGLYVSLGALIGLILPIAYIFHGIIEGDREGIKAAIPHVFLLASQVFKEGITFSKRFSLPIRVFVPVSYNTKRIFTIVEWLKIEIGKVEGQFSGSERRLYVGIGLAVANLVFWSFNLFGFLLPVYLPKAFKRYYLGSKVKV